LVLGCTNRLVCRQGPILRSPVNGKVVHPTSVCAPVWCVRTTLNPCCAFLGTPMAVVPAPARRTAVVWPVGNRRIANICWRCDCVHCKDGAR
jgi:hypothetical protein